MSTLYTSSKSNISGSGSEKFGPEKVKALLRFVLQREIKEGMVTKIFVAM